MKNFTVAVIGVTMGVSAAFGVAACLPDAACSAGFVAAEDGSCVPEGFWDEPVTAPAPVEAPAAALPTYTLPPCVSEDSTNCYWDAANMGNGEGTSFVNLNGTIYYPR